MNQHLQLLPIGLDEARAAYPLVSLHDGSISLEEWMCFSRLRGAGPTGSGLMGIRDRRGVIHAIFSYRVDLDIRASKKLCLSNLVMAQMPGTNIEDAVIAATNELANLYDCRIVTIEQRMSKVFGERGPCSTINSLLAGRITAPRSFRRH